MKKLIQTAVATLFAASSAQAQSPQLVPVQGFVSAEAPRWNVASMRFVGSRLAFGLPEDNTYGAVRFLEPAASGWRLSTTGIQSPDAECRDFGLSLAVDGTRVAVGSSSGHVFVFETATETPSLIAAWRAAPAGYALVHHLSGDALLVGLPASNGGQGGGALLRIQGAAMSVTQALVPERPAGRLGWSGGVSGDGIVLSAEQNAGNWHAMTWRRQGNGTWMFEGELLPSNPVGNPIFGCSSAIEGDLIAVGARDDSAAGIQSGACYIFERIGGRWMQTSKLTLSEPPYANQETGAHVAIRGGRVWFSAGGNSENGTGDRGRLLVADRVNGAWQVTQTLRSAESGHFTVWGVSAPGPSGSISAYGFDSPVPFSSWRLKCDVFAAPADCEQNGTHDLWQIWSGASADSNEDSIPDACQCVGDLNQDGAVDGADLGTLLNSWGACPGTCPADFDRNGFVDGADLGALLGRWGPCGN